MQIQHDILSEMERRKDNAAHNNFMALGYSGRMEDARQSFYNGYEAGVEMAIKTMAEVIDYKEK